MPPPARGSDWAHQRVPLAAGAELDIAQRIEVVERDRARFAFDDGVVDPRAAAADQPSRLAVGGGKPGAAEQLESRDTAGQLIPRQRDLRQFAAAAAALENRLRG